VKTTPRSIDELKRSAAPVALKAGWHPAEITEAGERPDKNGDDMIELVVNVGGRALKDWLSDKWAAAKLRGCCEAVGALDAYETGEISQDDFPGHSVQVKISIEKRRGFRDQYRIEGYRAAAVSSIASLRSVAKAVVLLGGVGLAASLLGACSSVVPGPGLPPSSTVDPPANSYAAAPSDDPLRQVADAAASRVAVPPAETIPSVTASPSLAHDLGNVATGAVIGATAPKIIKRAFGKGGLMGGAETGAVAGGALADGAAAGAEAGAAGVGAAEGAEVGAAVAGVADAAEAAEGAEILLLLFGL
jgi:hypothetical protein